MKIWYWIVALFCLIQSCEKTPTTQEGSSPSRILLLADTSSFPANWRLEFRQQLPAPHRLTVSDTGRETPAEVLKRLPWLLQPGVDEVYIVAEDWPAVWRDSLEFVLPQVSTLRYYKAD